MADPDSDLDPDLDPDSGSDLEDGPGDGPGGGLSDDDAIESSDVSDSPSGVDRVELNDDEISYDFAPWAGESRSLLSSLLESEGIRHVWQGTTLVVPVEEEATIDALVDDVQGVAAGALDPARERVVYEVGSWSAALQTSLVESLTVADVPYEWDESGDLVVYADDEAAVEAIFEAMPDPDDPDATDAEGVDVHQAVFQLWEAAGAIGRRISDAEAIVEFVDTTATVERMSVPFGYEPALWRDLCAEAGVIRDALESPDGNGLDDEALTAAAVALHQRLRPFV